MPNRPAVAVAGIDVQGNFAFNAGRGKTTSKRTKRKGERLVRLDRSRKAVPGICYVPVNLQWNADSVKGFMRENG